MSPGTALWLTEEGDEFPRAIADSRATSVDAAATSIASRLEPGHVEPDGLFRMRVISSVAGAGT